jgi:hypothetical protein
MIVQPTVLSALGDLILHTPEILMALPFPRIPLAVAELPDGTALNRRQFVKIRKVKQTTDACGGWNSSSSIALDKLVYSIIATTTESLQ